MFGSESGWCSDAHVELWNKGNSIMSINNNYVYKTIYDPSPSYFSLPKSAAFTAFTTTGYNSSSQNEFNVSGSFNNGWNFYCNPKFTGETIFFPTLGCRDGYAGRTTGALGSIVWYLNATYQTSSLQDYTRPTFLSFDSNGIYPLSTNMQTSYAFNIFSVFN